MGEIMHEGRVANQKRLDECDGPHNFLRCGNGPSPHYATKTPLLVGLARCTLCGGRVDESHWHMYDLGLAHGQTTAT